MALGDSVPAGAACHCTPYPELSAAALTVPGTREVSAVNDAVSGATTSRVLDQLTTNNDVQAHVAEADVVEIEVGANDVGYSGACGTDVSCYEPAVPSLAHNLGQIVAKVHTLAQGRTVLVVLLDYWSVWLGGDYAAAKGQEYVDAAAAVTHQLNTVIQETAAASASAYVDLRAAFKGPDYSYDETHYLESDGDHPNAAGHQLIAEAVVAVVSTTLQHS